MVSDDQQEQPIMQSIKERVAAQVEQEAAALPAHQAMKITSKFVMECLAANELGDGLLYAALHKDKFVFAKGAECWFVWDRHSWRRDEMDLAIASVESVAIRYAEEIVNQGAELAESIKKDDGRQEEIRAKIGQLHARVKRLRKDSGRKNCLAFAHTNPVMPLAVRAADFDLNPWMLACANGVINLKTGELEPGNPSDYISKRATAEFPANGLDADMSFWKNVLLSIYSDDAELVDYMQKLYGYGICGDRSKANVFPVLVGRGRNGKSLVVEALFNVLGEYAAPMPAELLLDNRNQSSTAMDSALLGLKGIRLAVASETAEGRKFGTERVKWLTGSDKLTARGLYEKNPTRWSPTHMLMLLTNHEPSASGTDTAFWERCRLIKHKLSFVDRPETEELKPYERKSDQDLAETLRGHSSSILAWLVQGCLKFQKEKLHPPAAVKKDTEEYRETENDIGQFIEEACIQGHELKIRATDLYDAYVHWFKATVNDKDKYKPSQKIFGQRFNSLDMFERKKSGGIIYVGIAVSDEYLAKMEEDEQKNQTRKSGWDGARRVWED